jgi:hypothetical protein
MSKVRIICEEIRLWTLDFGLWTDSGEENDGK